MQLHCKVSNAIIQDMGRMINNKSDLDVRTCADQN